MSAKAIALAVVGIVVFSSLFSLFHVEYPTGNPIPVKIDKNLKVNMPHYFSNQTLNEFRVGLNRTYFNSDGNASITVEGYARNATSGSPLSDTAIIAAVYAASTLIHTSGNGFYEFRVLMKGEAMIAFQTAGYNTVYHKFNFITDGSVFFNISFIPSQKYLVTGYTLFDGNPESFTGISFVNTKTYLAVSGVGGNYGILLPNGTYLISVHKTGFSSIPDPNVTIVSGRAENLNLSLFSSGSPAMRISGYVFNREGKPVSGSEVYDGMAETTSNSSGYYNISAAAGINEIVASGSGYITGNRTVFVYGNESNINITLTSIDPFSGDTGFYEGSGRLQESNVNYSDPGNYILSGNVYYNSSGYEIPLESKDISFYISVEGTDFYDYLSTNHAGNYTLKTGYSGIYNFTVYAYGFYPCNFTAPMGMPVTYHNIFLEPDNSLYNLNISVTDAAGSMPANVSISEAGINVGNYSTGSDGNLNLSLYPGNYSVVVSKPGFVNKTVNISLSGNTSETVNMTPENTLGNLSDSVAVSVPINGSPYLAGNSTVYSYGHEILFLNFTHNGKRLSDLEYQAFIEFDNKLYSSLGTTNASGASSLAFDYKGLYRISFYFLDYSGNLSVNLVSTAYRNVNLSLRDVHYLTLRLVDNFSRSNESVPASRTIADNNTFQINPLSISMLKNGTEFRYLLPVDRYYFSYINISYVQSSFAFSVSKNITESEKINPYLIVVEGNSSLPWNYSISGNVAAFRYNGNATNGKYENIINWTESSNVFSARAFASDEYVDNKTVNITPGNPVAYVYFNMTSHSYRAEMNVKLTNSNDTIVFTKYYLNINHTGYIYRFDLVNFTASNTTFYLNESGFNIYNETISSVNVSLPDIHSGYGLSATVFSYFNYAQFSRFYNPYVYANYSMYVTSLSEG